MHENRELLYFCCAEEDSIYALEQLRRQKEKGGLTGREERRLFLMEKRLEESRIYLAPAVIYAAANQKSCESWMKKADEGTQREWYLSGVAWMRRSPAFLERFGWKERRNAIMTAGIVARAENGALEEARDELAGLMKNGWKFLWERLGHSGCLDAVSFREMMEPWQESECMRSGMAGVLLLMTVLLRKPVYDRDRLWRDWRKLRDFCAECLKRPRCGRDRLPEELFGDDKKLEWLMEHFKNPQKLCYVREKGRIDNEWRDQLFRIMHLAGLPASACETISLSCKEVRLLLGELEGRLSAQKYMTFLALYTVAKQLAEAGRAAAALDVPPQK